MSSVEAQKLDVARDGSQHVASRQAWSAGPSAGSAPATLREAAPNAAEAVADAANRWRSDGFPPRQKNASNRIRSVVEGAAGESTGQLGRGPLHSEGMSAYAGNTDMSKQWSTMYRGNFKEGFGKGCTRAEPLGNDYAEEVGSIIAPGGVFDADKVGPRATTQNLDFRGTQLERLEWETLKAPGFCTGHVCTPRETHSRCIQHESQENWRGCLESMATSSQPTQKQLRQSLRSWMHGQTLSREEREKGWRRWQKQKLRNEPTGSGADGSSAVSMSVMPAGLQMGKATHAEVVEMRLNPVTWSEGKASPPVDCWIDGSTAATKRASSTPRPKRSSTPRGSSTPTPYAGKRAVSRAGRASTPCAEANTVIDDRAFETIKLDGENEVSGRIAPSVAPRFIQAPPSSAGACEQDVKAMNGVNGVAQQVKNAMLGNQFNPLTYTILRTDENEKIPTPRYKRRPFVGRRFMGGAPFRGVNIHAPQAFAH